LTKTREDLTHFETNISLPISDCSSTFDAERFRIQAETKARISMSRPGLTEIVIVEVFISTPKHTCSVSGGHAFEKFSVNPRSRNNALSC
jgi:hypothetical protein